MADRLAVARQTRGPVRQVALVLLLADRQADVRPAAAAVLALPALRGEQRDDVIADRQRLDARADRLDDARALVPEHGRRVPDGSTPEAVYRSVWQTPHATSRTSTSPALGSASSTSVDDQRLPELLQHCGLDPHGRPLLAVSSLASSAVAGYAGGFSANWGASSPIVSQPALYAT